MNVYYKEPIQKRILEAIESANMNGRQIDHIDLTEDESRAFRAVCGIEDNVGHYIYHGVRVELFVEIDMIRLSPIP